MSYFVLSGENLVNSESSCHLPQCVDKGRMVEKVPLISTRNVNTQKKENKDAENLKCPLPNLIEMKEIMIMEIDSEKVKNKNFKDAIKENRRQILAPGFAGHNGQRPISYPNF